MKWLVAIVFALGIPIVRGVFEYEQVQARQAVNDQLTAYRDHLCRELRQELSSPGMRTFGVMHPYLTPGGKEFETLCGSIAGFAGQGQYEWTLSDDLDLPTAANEVRADLEARAKRVRESSVICEENVDRIGLLGLPLLRMGEEAWVAFMKADRNILSVYCAYRYGLMEHLLNSQDGYRSGDVVRNVFLPAMQIGAYSASPKIDPEPLRYTLLYEIPHGPCRVPSRCDPVLSDGEAWIRTWLGRDQYDRRMLYWILSDMARSL